MLATTMNSVIWNGQGWPIDAYTGGVFETSAVGATEYCQTADDEFISDGPSVDLRRQLCDQNLFVFHLPAEWEENEMLRMFSPYGEILSVKVVKRPDGTSKGYGFVCYGDRQSAIRAVDAMNGYPVYGKRLKVSLKKTPEECLRLHIQKLLRMSEQKEPFDCKRDCSLFVYHLPTHWDSEELKEYFQRYGSVLAARVCRNEDGSSKGYGFVVCNDPRSAASSILNLNGAEICNKRLKVHPKQNPSDTYTRPGSTVFVFHLPSDWTDPVLKQFFSHQGDRVRFATVQRDNHGRSRGFGFVTFDCSEAAVNAVRMMNGVAVGTKRLKVSLKQAVSGSNAFAQANSPSWSANNSSGSIIMVDGTNSSKYLKSPEQQSVTDDESPEHRAMNSMIHPTAQLAAAARSTQMVPAFAGYATHPHLLLPAPMLQSRTEPQGVVGIPRGQPSPHFLTLAGPFPHNGIWNGIQATTTGIPFHHTGNGATLTNAATCSFSPSLYTTSRVTTSPPRRPVRI